MTMTTDAIGKTLIHLVKNAFHVRSRGQYVSDGYFEPAPLAVVRDFLDMISTIAPQRLGDIVKMAFRIYFQYAHFDHHNLHSAVTNSKDAIQLFITDYKLPIEALLENHHELLKTLMKTRHSYALMELFNFGLRREHLEPILFDYLKDILSLGDEVQIHNNYGTTVDFLLSQKEPNEHYCLKIIHPVPMLKFPISDTFLANQLRKIFPRLKFQYDMPTTSVIIRDQLYNDGHCSLPECSFKATATWKCLHGICAEHYQSLLEHKLTDRCCLCRQQSDLIPVVDQPKQR